MGRIPCGALLTLHPSERDAVEAQLELSLTDLKDAIEDVCDQYLSLKGTIDYVLSGKKTRAAEIGGFTGLDDLA